MAETFLTPVIESLLQLLTNEVRSLTSVHREVESLRRELEIIQCLLKDAEARSDTEDLSDVVKTWMKQLKEEADRIEDVVDEYRHHVAQSITDKQGFVGFLSNISHQIKGLMSRYVITSKIRNITKSLRKIKNVGQAYGLTQSLVSLGSSSKIKYVEENDLRLGALFVVEDDEYVDVPNSQEEFKRSVITQASTRTIISLVGQGGIGKTTLARKVYNELKHNFDCHAWITVSQSYDVDKLLKIMMQQMCAMVECTSVTGENDMIQGLITPLRHYLQTKRYVVVFDDVWNADFWEVMKHALPNNNKGAKIIITTRNATIANNCKEASTNVIQELQTWSPDMAWNLFCKKTFRYEFEKHCPKELEKLSHEIVRQCQGLPLTIGTIAGLLSRKRKVQFEWERVLKNLNSEFKTNPELTRITKILSLSYHDLPYHIRSCLLYFGVFPPTHEIHCDRLYQLWIAEGLVKATGEKTLEDVAKDNLNELIKRNLVSFEMYWGTQQYCRVHDLMHEFILSRSNDICFCQVLCGKNSTLGGKSRRLSIHGSMNNFLENIKKYSSVRSIFLFNFNDQLINMSSLVTLFRNSKFLKVLDFEGAPLAYLPDEVGTAFHLRYLNLKDTKIKVIPKCIGELHNLQTLNLMNTPVEMLPTSIGKLHNLQTLNLYFTSVRELPMEICKLQNLRHINAFSMDKTKRNNAFGAILGVRIQASFGHLENLETLEYVEVHPSSVVSFIKDLEKLKKLKVLGLSELTTGTSRALCASIKKLNHLERLFLATSNEDDILDVEPLSSSPPLLLHALLLSSQLQRFPLWISELWNLQTLCLCFSKLTDDPLKYVKDLPNLITLQLLQSYDGGQLQFEAGFPKLKDLTLSNLKGLKLVKMDEGTLPFLEILILDSCSLMEEVPYGIQHLRNLKELTIRDMPAEFVVRIQPNTNEGLDYPKIQHVPIVQIKYTSSAQRGG